MVCKTTISGIFFHFRRLNICGPVCTCMLIGMHVVSGGDADTYVVVAPMPTARQPHCRRAYKELRAHIILATFLAACGPACTCKLIDIRRGFGGGADIYVVVWGWRLCQHYQVAAREGVVIFLWVGRGRALSAFRGSPTAVLVAFFCPVSCCYAHNERGVICLLLLCTHHLFGLPSAHADLSLFSNFRRSKQPVKGLLFFCGWVEGVSVSWQPDKPFTKKATVLLRAAVDAPNFLRSISRGR